MPRRTILTERQREALFGLPTDEPTLIRHYVLSDSDIVHVQKRRRTRNKLGFALQVCALRYPGRLLQPGEYIPEPVLRFVGAQLGVSTDDLIGYATRRPTHYEHSSVLQEIYGYRPFEASDAEFSRWLDEAAEHARSNEGLARSVIIELRRRHIIVPAPTTVERLCADALVAAENRMTLRIANRLDQASKERLIALLHETMPTGVTCFVYLRKHEPGNNSRQMNLLLDRFETVVSLDVDTDVLKGIPLHRIARLRRQGERYYADGMRDLPEHRRLAILAVCSVEWRSGIADAIVETHDRIVGKLYRTAERSRDAQVNDQRALIQQTLRNFADVGSSILAAQQAGDDIGTAIEHVCGWESFENLVNDAVAVNAKVSADPLDFVGSGYHRFRLYARRFIKTLTIEGARSAKPLLAAIKVLSDLNVAGDHGLPDNAPIGFARPK